MSRGKVTRYDLTTKPILNISGCVVYYVNSAQQGIYFLILFANQKLASDILL